MTRLGRAVDKFSPKLKELRFAQDGTEINDRELERVIERCRYLGERHDGFEQLRDSNAEYHPSDRGNTWRSRHGSHTSRTSQLTSATIGVRDFLRARQNEKTQAHLPQSMLLAVFGSKPVGNTNRTCAALADLCAKVADMVLVCRAVYAVLRSGSRSYR